MAADATLMRGLLGLHVVWPVLFPPVAQKGSFTARSFPLHDRPLSLCDRAPGHGHSHLDRGDDFSLVPALPIFSCARYRCLPCGNVDRGSRCGDISQRSPVGGALWGDCGRVAGGCGLLGANSGNKCVSGGGGCLIPLLTGR